MSSHARKTDADFGDDYAAVQVARSESPVRRLVKRFYLDRILRHVDGPTLDIGCGAGQLLMRLPPASRGLEVNPVLVAQLRTRGLDVEPVKPDPARIVLNPFDAGRFRTVVLSHVLEHFDRAEVVLERLIADCGARGVQRLIVVVPGAVGYRSDRTHRTFVTIDHLRRHALLDTAHARVRHRSYFPGNVEWLGRWFVYHELMLVYEIGR